MAGPGFVHLHVHSSYSLLEGALTIARLAELAKADHQPALALTDTDNMFGALEFSEKLAGSGIQPIIGCALAVDFGDQDDWRAPQRGATAPVRPRIVLLAAREAGYRSLMRLNSRAFLETPPNEAPHIKLAWLEGETDGLIALTGGPGGPLDAAIVGRPGRACGGALRCAGAAVRRPALYRAAAPRPRSERHRGAGAGRPGLRRGIPLVATNEPYFATREDYEAHDALIAIAEGRLVADTDRRQLTAEHRFKTRAEMAALFADLPEAVASTVEIARRCAFRPRTLAPILPRFSVGEESRGGRRGRGAAPAGGRRARRRLAVHGLAPGRTAEDYRERLDFELGVIERMKYPGYFLIVADFIQWAKAQRIPVGPGRGSGAGSLVAYALTITDLDPIRFGLLFERFLNPERISMPDFDIDFCQDRRDEVIRYVQGKYGHDRVAQIITFGTLQARGVLRDVGRVLQMPYGQVDKLCKLVPQNPANPVTLKRAIDDEPRLQAERDRDPVVRRAFDIAQKLEGLHRHASTHAAGIVIGERPLERAGAALSRSEIQHAGDPVQHEMGGAGGAGQIRLPRPQDADRAGDRGAARWQARHRARSVAHPARRRKDLRDAGARRNGRRVPGGKSGHAARAASTCGRTGSRTSSCWSRSIGRGRWRTSRPIARASSAHEPIDYLHPKLEPILRADLRHHHLPGAGAADRARSRRLHSRQGRHPAPRHGQEGQEGDGVAARRLHQRRGRARHRPLRRRRSIFDACAKFAEYGFNKSHAAPYALLTYQTAYLKANYPVEFLAASMTLDMGNTDKLSEFRAEAERLGIKVVPPSVNRSGVDVRRGRRRDPLFAGGAEGRRRAGGRERSSRRAATSRSPISPISRAASIRARSTSGCWKASRLPARSMRSKRTARALSRRWTRSSASAQRAHDAAEMGQSELVRRPGGARRRWCCRQVEPWPPAERLQKEFDAIGFFLSGHPLDDYAPALKRMRVQSWAEFARSVKAGASAGRVAGSVVSRQERRTRTGSKMGIIGLSDPSGHYEAVLFSEGLAQFRDQLEPGKAVLLALSAELQGDDVRARIQKRRVARRGGGEDCRRACACSCATSAAGERRQAAAGTSGRGKPAPDKSDGEVSMVLILGEGTEVEVKLPGRFKVSPQIAGAIKAIPGVRRGAGAVERRSVNRSLSWRPANFTASRRPLRLVRMQKGRRPSIPHGRSSAAASAG